MGHLVLVDIDEVAVGRAVSRYNKRKAHGTTSLDAAVTDLRTPGLRGGLRYEYDVVTW